MCSSLYDHVIGNETKRKLKVGISFEQEWTDYKFVWNPDEYGGVTELYVPSEHIWLPDIVVYNK